MSLSNHRHASLISPAMLYLSVCLFICQFASHAVAEQVADDRRSDDTETRLVLYCDEEEKGTTQRFVQTPAGFIPERIGLPSARDLILDVPGRRIYGTFKGGNASAKLDGSDFKRLDNRGGWGIDIDPETRKLYWADEDGKAIFVADLDGANRRQLIGGLRQPRGIAVDTKRNLIFWADSGEAGTNRVHRANLDGSQPQTIGPLGQRPLNVAVDVEAGRIYWTDGVRIRRSNLDGGNVEDVVVEATCGAIVLFQKHVFWTDAHLGKIRQADLNGKNIVDLVTNLKKPKALLVMREPVPRKLAKPNEAALERANSLVQRLFEKEFQLAESASQKARLSGKLLALALETSDDPVARFALLAGARDLAASAGLAEKAFEAIRFLSEYYADVDDTTMKADALSAATDASPFPSANKALAESAVAVIQEAIRDDNLPLARQLEKTAQEAAGKARDAQLTALVAGLADELDWVETEFKDYERAVKELENNPDDSRANLAAGEYLCLAKQDWQTGLPLLAKGNDLDFARLAKQELAGPRNPDEQTMVGDGWWKLAEGKAGPMQSRLKHRAIYWYEKALPNLSGISRTRIEKRLESVEKTEP